MDDAERLRRAALAYAEHGLPVFPVHVLTDGACSCGSASCASPGKHPMTPRGFLDATREPLRIHTWWTSTPHANIGLVPGRGGLVAFDIDTDEARAVAAVLGLCDVETLVCVTANGEHRYFRVDIPPDGSPQVDGIICRSTGGYVIAPPSRHPSGHRYHWRGRFHQVARLPARALEALAAATSRPVTAPAPRIRRLPRETLPEHLARERRIDAYLRSVGAAGEGSRNNTAYRVAAFLVHDVACRPDEAWARLCRWNERNAPPLTTRELGACMKSAVRHGGRIVRRPLVPRAIPAFGGLGKRS